MKKKSLLLFLTLLLSSCSLFDAPKNQEKNENNKDEIVIDEDNVDEEDVEEFQFKLDKKENFSWHNGHKPCYDEYWEYHIKTTINPDGALWENPNESVDYSGVEFKDRNSYIISPTFKSYKNIIFTADFWCSALTSQKYKTTDNDPQFTIEGYNTKHQRVEIEYVTINKNEISKDNKPLTKTVTLNGSGICYFKMLRTNYIANGNSSYDAILCDASLVGKN